MMEVCIVKVLEMLQLGVEEGARKRVREKNGKRGWWEERKPVIGACFYIDMFRMSVETNNKGRCN